MKPTQHLSEDPLAALVDNVTATLQALTAELTLVRGVCDAIGNAQSLTELCTMLNWMLARAIDSRCAAVFWDTPEAPFRLQALWSSPSVRDQFPGSLAGSRLAATLKESKKPILIKDIAVYSSPAEPWPFPSPYVAFLLIPLIHSNKLRGVLCFCDDRPGIFNEAKFLAVSSVMAPIVATMTRMDPRA